MMIEWIDMIINFILLKKTNAQLLNHLGRHYEHLQNTCRETVYFVKEVKANSEDEAEKLHANVNGFKDVEEWTEEWEIAEMN